MSSANVAKLAPRPEPPSELEEEAVPALAVPKGLNPNLSLPMQVAALAIWPLLENFLGFLVGFVDAAVSGQLLSVESTNAVGAAVYLLWFIGMLVGAAGVGATALIARAAGAGRWRRANSILAQALIIALSMGICLGSFFRFGAPVLSSLSGLEGVSKELCDMYLQLVVLAVPCSAVLFVGSACLRGSGDTRTPFMIMVVVNVINIVACLSLVHPRSPIGGHGLEGLAYGTVLAWMVGALSLLGVLIHGRANLRLRWRFLTPRIPVLRRIIRVGLPNLAEGAGMWVGNYIIVILVGRLADKAAMGAHFITMRVEALSFLPGFALAVSAATLTGQFLGVNDVRSARRAAWWCWGYGATLMTFTGLLFVAFPEVFIRMVTDKAEFLNTCPLLLRIVGLVQIGFASAIIFASVHRGAGDTRRAMVITYGSIFLLRLPLVYYLAIVQDLGLLGVWIGLSVELLLRGMLFLGSFLQGHWAKAKV